MKRAFTLIEMLVVVGIIGVLMTVILTVAGNGTESARAAKCLSNMRALVSAVNAAAQANAPYYTYPGAGSRATHAGRGDFGWNDNAPGWIKWLSNVGDPFGKKSGKLVTQKPHVDECMCDSTDRENVEYAMQSGKAWKGVNKNDAVFKCPTYALYCSDHNLHVNWTYVMNGYFGYAADDDEVADARKVYYGSLDNADRVLMFAEYPLRDPTSPKEYISPVGSGSTTERDAILQYNATVNGDQYASGEKAKAEQIGFVHKSASGRYCAHVAFADGHVEKLLNPIGNGGLKVEELTALLCEGRQVSFDGKVYNEVRDED